MRRRVVSRRILSGILSLCMVCCLTPVLSSATTVSAAETSESVPVTTVSAAETSESVPVTTVSAAETSESVPATTVSAAETSESVPVTTVSGTATTASVPATTVSAAATSESVPETTVSAAASTNSGSASIVSRTASTDQTIRLAEGNAQQSQSTDTEWYRSSDQEFVLTTAAQLYGFAQIVNGEAEGIAADDFTGKTVKLGEDLDLSGTGEWTPIGTISFSSPGVIQGVRSFAGTFDGQNHRISGMTIEDENGGVALFSYSQGTIENLTVSGTVTGNYQTAGICAYGCGVFRNLVSEVKVTAQGNCNGGILADASGDVEISSCHNRGVVTNNNAASERSTGRVGGIVGRINTGCKGTIENCSNTANITAYQYVAGIIGGCFGNVEIKGCFNTGNIRAISFGKAYLGGIAGKLENGTIDSCYNTGNLDNTPVSKGHVRAVGGLAGCEEGHSQGTAISNSYNAGTISLHTQYMVSGTNYIYMSGNISGGNSTTDENSMHYKNCYYREGCYPAQSEENSDYIWWSDVYKENHLAYDTADIISRTEAELKSEQMPELLGSSFKADPDGGYPLLYWQTGSEKPEGAEHAVTGSVAGGSAVLSVKESAKSGEQVSFSISGIEQGKMIHKIVVLDASGASISAERTEGEDRLEGEFSFEMPDRDVQILVTLERIPSETASYYRIDLPQTLDAIWEVSMDATFGDGARVKAGSTVTIIVSKQQNAVTTDFNGITVLDQDNAPVETESTGREQSFNGARYYGEYSFTMPESEVTVEVNQIFSPLTVYTRTEGEEASVVCNLSRSDMEELSQAGTASKNTEKKGTYTGTADKKNSIDNVKVLDSSNKGESGSPVQKERVYYSGWSSETQPFMGVAESYVTLDQLLQAVDVPFQRGDTLTLTGADGFSQCMSYENLYQTGRKTYLDILENGSRAENSCDFSPCFVIKGNMTSDPEETVSEIPCDTLNAYRFVYGQTEEELKNQIKIVDSMPKCLVSVTITHPKDSEGKLFVNEYGNGWQMACFVTDQLPEQGHTYLLGETELMLNPAYAQEVEPGQYVFTALVKNPSDEAVREVSGNYETAEAPSGDVNQDGKTNIIDAQFVMYLSYGSRTGQSVSESESSVQSGLASGSSAQSGSGSSAQSGSAAETVALSGLMAADVNTSGSITVLDARAIQYYVHYGCFGSF